ncbi:MAG: SDR family NAD(P)-dependent oxidoreductase [Legionella sp.]
MSQREYVLITGASGGIGEALALCFAKQGYPLVLVALTKAKLEHVAAQCRQLNQQEALILEMDLAEKEAAQKVYQQVHEAGIFVGILINNAGIGSWGSFADNELVEQERLVQLNLTTVVALTHFFVQDMLQQQRGKIVNIASVYSYSHVPYQAVYAASKAFLLSFGCALAKELQQTGIKVITICPGTTLTGFRHTILEDEKPSALTMTATEVAELAYKHIERDNLIYTPGFINRVFVCITCLLPMRPLLSVVSGLVYKARGYKKLKKL